MIKPQERLGRLVLSPAILSDLIRVAQTGEAGAPQAAMRGTGMRPAGRVARMCPVPARAPHAHAGRPHTAGRHPIPPHGGAARGDAPIKGRR